MRLIQTAVQYDHLTFSLCQQLRSRHLLVAVSRQISRSADGYLYVVLGLLAWLQGSYSFVELAVSAFLVERSLYFFLKKYTKRNRPPDKIPGFQSIIIASDRFSFPSGHTSAAFLTATLLFTQLPASGLLMFPWACSVAWSRVMLGVHFPSDTLAGASLGSLVAIYCVELELSLVQLVLPL